MHWFEEENLLLSKSLKTWKHSNINQINILLMINLEKGTIVSLICAAASPVWEKHFYPIQFVFFPWLTKVLRLFQQNSIDFRIPALRYLYFLKQSKPTCSIQKAPLCLHTVRTLRKQRGWKATGGSP